MKQNFINKNEPSENPNLHNGHEYVDLGLPSGLLWATCNIGASTPEEYGDYFAWGETEPKQIYSKENYKFSISIFSSELSKYNKTDNLTELEDIDDAAHVNWGGNWRMPSLKQYQELIDNCTWTWDKDKKGYEVKSKTNGNTIFLPVAGHRGGDNLYHAGFLGDFWSRSLNTNIVYEACFLSFHHCNVGWFSFFRYYGHSVRAVCTRV